MACWSGSLEVVKVLYDAFPHAIIHLSDEYGLSYRPVDLAKKESVNRFLQVQVLYAHKAKDLIVMTTPDENGWLPLHHALKDNAPLGSIKLLVKGNPSAIRTADPQGVYPLHIACEFSSSKVVEYLLTVLDSIPMNRLDANEDSVLHYACRGSNLEVVKYLLNEHTSLLVSAEVNGDGELPIHLLCEAGKKAKVDIDKTKYVETIWRMLLVNQGKLPLHLLCEAGKDNEVDSDDSTEYTETIWLMLLANPEVILRSRYGVLVK